MQNHVFCLRTGAAISALTIGLIAPPVHADENDARTILQAMSDYMASAQSLAFDYDSMLEIVTTDGQKIGIAASGAVALTRPDKLRATRLGGFTDLEMVFDGATFSLLGNHAGVYTQLPIEGSTDTLIDALREEYGRPLPAADLLTASPYDILMSEVVDVKDLGAGVFRGQVCDHLAFRTPDVDWQIWIATGGKPYPCRYVITTHSMARSPQYTVDIRDWQGGQQIDPAAFSFTPPDGATGITFEEYHKAVRELPDHFVIGKNK